MCNKPKMTSTIEQESTQSLQKLIFKPNSPDYLCINYPEKMPSYSQSTAVQLQRALQPVQASFVVQYYTNKAVAYTTGRQQRHKRKESSSSSKKQKESNTFHSNLLVASVATCKGYSLTPERETKAYYLLQVFARIISNP